MADIFISYSKKEPQWTIDLARDLEAQGHTVWWDTTGLLPGDAFPVKIRAEITAARAVIVIWSESSVASEWVYAEAEEAQLQGKLIITHVPRLNLRAIPMPFTGKHSDPVTEREKIYAALAARGLAPVKETAEARFAKSQANIRDMQESAARGFRLAAEEGDARGFTMLGLLYEHGRGVSKDLTVAKLLYAKAADMGEDVAKQRLAELE